MAKSRAQYIQEHSDGSNDISFDLVDEATVKRLQRDKKIKVPKKKVDIPKDKRWNEKQMASKILQGIQNGDSIAKMSKSMTEVIGNNLTSAIRNTRTMTTSAECNGRLDSYKSLADQGVVQKKVWMATPDDRTRPTHIDLDGEEQDIDKAFSNGCQFPGDGNGPAEEVWQCFTGETSMATDSEVVRSYKHWYDGDLIKVKTASGVYFACTPNHPILSEFGWVRANGLNNGDNLLVTFVRDNSFFVSRRNPNIKHIFSRMDTFHKTLDVVFSERRSNLTMNFHGDIATTNVEVVSQKRLLGICNNSCIIKSLYKLLFKLTYSFLSCKGNFVKCFFGLKFSTNSGMSGTRKLFSILGRCLRHSKIHSTRPVTRGDSVLLKTMIDNSTTDTEFFCESLDGLSRVVFLDKIIDIQIDTFHGYVYNLQTDDNYYFVNNIISQKQEKNNCIYAIAHNCRCTMTDHIIGFKRADGSISYVDYDRDATKHDEQMKAEKERRGIKVNKSINTFEGAVKNLTSKYDVNVDLSEVKRYKDEAEKNVVHLNKLMEEYKSTAVSYKVVKNVAGAEAGGAYMLNQKTSILVQEKAFKTIKATDDLRLGDKQDFGITYHEFAHSLSQSREKVDPEFWKEMRKLKKEYASELRFGEEKISTYAMHDVDEFMAEAFTQAKLSDNPSEYSIRALEIIDKYFKR